MQFVCLVMWGICTVSVLVVFLKVMTYRQNPMIEDIQKVGIHFN